MKHSPRDYHERLLKTVCDLPTAPYCERHVSEWLLAWAAARPALRVKEDRAGNIYLEYRRGRASKRPLVIEAHTDHPGFIATRQKRDGGVEAIFRGGVRPSHFKDARMRFWLPADVPYAPGSGELPAPPAGRWVPAKVRSVKPAKGKRPLTAILSLVKEKIPPGTLGMWDLPDARISGNYFTTRVCDDLAGVAAMLCMLDNLIREQAETHVVGVCSRAEEVGFAGVLAICENGWLPKGCPIIGLETSKAFAQSPQGDGPVIRVGDQTGLFSSGLTYFLSQTAAGIADDDAAFKFQRKLMDGGTCNSTAFAAWGYDAAAMCLALGNYHNMHIKEDIGYRLPGVATAGPGIASEVVRIEDFHGMVRILTHAAGRISGYQRGMKAVQARLAKLHREEQVKWLYAKR